LHYWYDGKLKQLRIAKDLGFAIKGVSKVQKMRSKLDLFDANHQLK